MNPPFLKFGSKVAITAPASKVELNDLLIGIEILKSWGLDVVIGATVGKSFHNFSDNHQNRLSELQHFLNDSSVDCILAARGGYGVSDLIDSLDFEKFRTHPKWVIGFSDLTALLLQLNRIGYTAIHGPMAKTLNFDSFSSEKLREILFGHFPAFSFPFHFYNKLGNGKGVAVGGNLVLLTHSLGSLSDISYDNKILFIEDIGEKMYSIDRLMVQLKRAGKLENLSGLVVGDFSEIGENSVPFGSQIEDIILNHTQTYQYPVAFGFPFGHESVNLPIIMGGEYMLEVTEHNSLLNSLENEIG